MSDNIVSVGDDWRQWPRELWGSRDRACARREERQAAKDDQWILTGVQTPPPDHVLAWNLYGHTKQDEERQRRQNIQRLEQKRGLRPKPWV